MIGLKRLSIHNTYVKQHKNIIKCLSKYIIAGITREDPVNFGGRYWISSESEEVIKRIGIGFGVSQN